jgi:nitrogen fixation protein NifB
MDGHRYTGTDAAALLWERQRQSIQALAARAVIVKVNTIYTPGINDTHIEQIAQTVAGLGATILNVMPLLPTVNTPFVNFPDPDRQAVQAARGKAVQHLKQMTHCSRCRADAVGLLGEADTQEKFELLQIAAEPSVSSVAQPHTSAAIADSDFPMTLSRQLRLIATAQRPYVAVATKDGLLVDQHLGEARQVTIYNPSRGDFKPVDVRSIATDVGGSVRWLSVIDKLQDCCGILVSGAGAVPRKIFAHHGITVAIVEGVIDEALSATAAGKDLSFMVKPRFVCASSCSGGAGGCV